MTYLALALLFLVCVMALTIRIQYHRATRQYKILAESLCDPGSWKITFLLRMVILSGTVEGLPIRYSVLGSPQGDQFTSSYLLLLYPVGRNLRVYAESDLSQVDDAIRPELEVLQQTEGFRSLILTPGASPFLGKFLSRPFGFPYASGILLWKLGPGAFDPTIIRADLAHIEALSQKSRESSDLSSGA
jgi:hypothetical protein